MDYRADAVVIGAGVVGLAIARALALAGREVLVLERGNGIGQETSSRNSGVIHAGIYYPPGSLKARLCVRGRELLYAFARERGVAHARCGKLVVGSSAQRGTLAAIAARAHACGVTDIVELDGAAIRESSPWRISPTANSMHWVRCSTTPTWYRVWATAARTAPRSATAATPPSC
jgi:L-2-hydroxyglutarate oxidase LhgO